MICNLIVGYKGMINLADRAGQTITSEVVRANDEFDYSLGTDQHITHKPRIDGERGEIIGAYAVAIHPDDRKQFKVIGRDEINRAKQSSAAASSGPWKTDEAAMVAKTAVRRLAPFLPLSPEFARAVELDEAADRGEQIIDVPFDVETTPEERSNIDAATATELESEIDETEQSKTS